MSYCDYIGRYWKSENESAIWQQAWHLAWCRGHSVYGRSDAAKWAVDRWRKLQQQKEKDIMPMSVTINGVQPAPVKKLLGVARSSLKSGQVFRYYKNGVLGAKNLFNIGRNGKFLSYNPKSGDIATTANANGDVKVVGSWLANMSKATWGAQVQTTRGALQNGDVFTVKGGKKKYVHLSMFTDGRFAALNPTTGDYAITRNGSKKVTKVGTASLAATLTA